MDTDVVVWLATHRVHELNVFFVELGNASRLGLVWVAAAVAIGWTRRSGVASTALLAFVVALTTFAADSVSFGVKDLVHRDRPFVAHHQIHPLYPVHSSSFPAGHAATAFAGATILAYVAPRAAPLLGLVATLIGFSRVYVGVHYPTDVLAGAAIGIVVGAVGIAVLRLGRRREVRPVVLAFETG